MSTLQVVIRFLTLCVVLSIVGCKDYSEISIAELDAMMEESTKHSMSKWVLVDESDSHYFIEYSRGPTKSVNISISKNDISIGGDNSNLPRVLKFADIKYKGIKGL